MASRLHAGWKTKLPNVRCAVLPASTTRPNPLVADDLLIASVFSPGAVCALGRRSGKLIWRRSIHTFGSASAYFANGTLFAMSDNTIHALDPKTGEVRWRFKPYDLPGEWIYSAPVVHRRLLFFGDRAGNFTCLDAQTGRVRWRRQPSRRRSNQVNATALIDWPRVVTATNNGTVVCYKALTGATVWRQRVDGPCARELLRYGSGVVIPARSLYVLDLRSGRVKQRLVFAGQSVYSATVANRRVLAVLGPDSDHTGKAEPPWELGVVERGRLKTKHAIWGISSLRTCGETGNVYLCDAPSVEVIDPETGASLSSKRKLMMALPDVRDGMLYGLADDGIVFAETHTRRGMFSGARRER